MVIKIVHQILDQAVRKWVKIPITKCDPNKLGELDKTV